MISLDDDTNNATSPERGFVPAFFRPLCTTWVPIKSHRCTLLNSCTHTHHPLSLLTHTHTHTHNPPLPPSLPHTHTHTHTTLPSPPSHTHTHTHTRTYLRTRQLYSGYTPLSLRCTPRQRTLLPWQLSSRRAPGRRVCAARVPGNFRSAAGTAPAPSRTQLQYRPNKRGAVISPRNTWA